jgi:hypothetical protein
VTGATTREKQFSHEIHWHWNFQEAVAFDGFEEDGVSSFVHDASVSYAKNNHFNTNLKKSIHVHEIKGLASAQSFKY